MGRPWWYDSYWDKRQPRRRPPLPVRAALAWAAVIILSLLISWTRSGPGHTADLLVYLFVLYLCRVLSIAVLARAVLSWFMVGGFNVIVFVLDDLTEPVMRPLRRVIPLIGRVDLSPAVAILLLALAPFILGLVLGVR